MDKIASSRILLRAVRELEASLIKPYEERSATVEVDFLSAVREVSLFSRVVFKDLASRKGQQISAGGAWGAAIALGDFDQALRFLDMDIDDHKRDGRDLDRLAESVTLSLQNSDRSERWDALLAQIKTAKTNSN
ncbi:hypothetical protein [Tateyamaria sp.]|uniref:hypothetical protein n=1 Tax=Tateyamaria sp. TaxID=1929288 RepID=UPI00329E708A